MSSQRLKAGYFVVEGINAFATGFYFNYLFFFMQARFGYGNMENLALGAANGFIYLVAAWYGGRFAQAHGYFLALRLGIGGMILALALGTQVSSASAHWLIMGIWTTGMCFTWPTLEALVSEGESVRRLPRMIGIYNLTWAWCNALAFFIGGALIELFGFSSLFLIPVVLHVVQFVLVTRLQLAAKQPVRLTDSNGPSTVTEPDNMRHAPERRRVFLQMAWIANPFAYVALTTIIAIIPGLAQRHELTPMWAGFFCSIWLFARFATFAFLWFWSRWHYRFRWFITGYLLLLTGFFVILLAPSLWMVLMAQVFFGAATGLIYYSSLLYSMDVGETKGVHGGIHEAAIGAGIFGGPAVGALGLFLFPASATAGVWAVGGLLLLGLGSILRIQQQALRRRRLAAALAIADAPTPLA
jgi:MFS family permease